MTNPDHGSQFVAYYRVSTQQQGQSGLGLEAQLAAVSAYMATQSDSDMFAEFTEIESGKKKNRPELAEAIKLCKRQKATLIIAKLDRLARNVHFISGLMESRVNFVACDNPHANRLMMHLLAAFAEHEREMISQRTKEGLKAAKARGIELGANGKALAAQNRAKADQHAISIIEQVRSIPDELRPNVSALTRQMNARAAQQLKVVAGTGRASTINGKRCSVHTGLA